MIKHLSSDNMLGVKLAGVSVVSSLTSIPLDDTTQIGQIVSILIGIVSGMVSLFKLFKKKK
jgi:hypothetical protein